MPDPNSDPSIQMRRNRPGAPANGNGVSPANGSPEGSQAKPAALGAMPAFFGTLAALIVFALLAVGGYFRLPRPYGTVLNACEYGAPWRTRGPCPRRRIRSAIRRSGRREPRWAQTAEQRRLA